MKIGIGGDGTTISVDRPMSDAEAIAEMLDDPLPLDRREASTIAGRQQGRSVPPPRRRST